MPGAAARPATDEMLMIEDGRTQTWKITGEDEADPTKGSVSHVSPLARALIGKRVGEEATVAGQSVEVVAVD